MLIESDIRKLAVDYATAFIGKWYKWGGDDPEGFDCSGLVIEVLKAVGVLKRRGDWRARDLYAMFDMADPRGIKPGDLVFWRGASSQGPIIHIEMMINDQLAIGASGGGSSTITIADAVRHNAFIKMRPVVSRAGVAGYRNPYSKPYYKIYD
jgi:cell wall-associated NlpC family hydrolase